MFCPNCGKELKEGAKFCASCGEPVGSAPASPASTGVGGAAGAAAPAAVAGAGTPAAGAMKTKRSKTPFIAGGAVLAAVVAVLVLVLVVKPFGGGGYSSAEGLLDAYSQSEAEFIDTTFAGDLTVDSLVDSTFAAFGDYLPEGAVDAVMAQGGYSSETVAMLAIFAGSEGMTYLSSLSAGDLDDDLQEVVDELNSSIDTLSPYMSMLDITVSFSPGTYLDAFAISEVESEFASYGLSYDVQEACRVQGSVTATLTEDYNGVSAGESQTQECDEDSTGLLAVKIGGSWYLWSDSALGTD